MMQFSIEKSNHGHVGYIADYLDLLRLLVEAAGHSADGIWGADRGCHIWCDGFSPAHIRAMESAKKAGHQNIIVATEFVTGATFNAGAGAGCAQYSEPTYWQRRRDALVACLPYVRAVWCSCDDAEQLRLHQQMAGEVPVLPLPFPCCASRKLVEHQAKKDIDVFFWGSWTNHRADTMTAIGKRHATFYRHDFVHEGDRRETTARSKICLALKQSPQWRFPSQMRYWYHLSNASFILGEQCEARCGLDEYVPSVPSAELPAVCDDYLASGDWQQQAAEAYERFAAERPAKAEAERLFDLTFSRGQ